MSARVPQDAQEETAMINTAMRSRHEPFASFRWHEKKILGS
ncbi:MAG: hypothetical protein WAW80_04645 [Candidatus Saccharimonadales bacterium]